MKNTILTIFAIVSLSLNAQKIKIKGSDTVLPIAQKEAENYMKDNPGKIISVVGGGSGIGITALADKTTDIASSSRKIRIDEKLKFTSAGSSVKEVTIAFDALSVVVNPSNKISQLTKEQLEKIYTGKISNWKELGGDDMKIVVYTRESSSGTYEFFKEKVLSGKNFASSALSLPATGAIVQSIAQTKGAIGYIGIAYDTPSVKQIKVSFNKGKTFIAPSIATAKDKTYPLTRPLFFYYSPKSEALVKGFIEYVLSKKGQDIVTKVGFVSL
ncbi:MAG: PstS family phosphate ABC transporter substrate-binding protein [Solirubrobacteraceae bacterium]